MTSLVSGVIGGVVGGPIASVATSAINALLGSSNPRLFYGDGFNFVIPCTVREHHEDSLTITDHPVEFGAQISDHAFVNPPRLIIEVVYGAGQTRTMQEIYQQFLSLHQSRVLFNIVTGKRRYTNMLIEEMEVTTDARSENMIAIRMRCRFIIIVSTQVVQASKENQSNGQNTGSPSQKGTVQTFPLKNQSVIAAIPL